VLPRFDGITIEHNGVLVDRNDARHLPSRMLAHLLAPGGRFNALHISAMGSSANHARTLPAQVMERANSLPCWVVNLQRVRERGDYLSLLSAKRRAHIRRSQRACEALGALRVTSAETPAQALEFLRALQALHAQRRHDLGKTSDFCTPFGEAFHERLVAAGHARGEVQLLRVQAGDHDLGYVYNFVHRGRISFYQSGFDYGLIDRRYSPGLVTLVQVIEHNTRLGHTVFDFLAGDMPYKAALATDCETLVTVSLHRDTPLFRLEQAVRAGLLALRARGWLRNSVAMALAAALSWGEPGLPEPLLADEEPRPERRVLRPA
jgi:CelD/BcsL family acetyltransferase involved in cellulose biosynthesis